MFPSATGGGCLVAQRSGAPEAVHLPLGDRISSGARPPVPPPETVGGFREDWGSTASSNDERLQHRGKGAWAVGGQPGAPHPSPGSPSTDDGDRNSRAWPRAPTRSQRAPPGRSSLVPSYSFSSSPQAAQVRQQP